MNPNILFLKLKIELADNITPKHYYEFFTELIYLLTNETVILHINPYIPGRKNVVAVDWIADMNDIGHHDKFNTEIAEFHIDVLHTLDYVVHVCTEYSDRAKEMLNIK